MEKKIQKKILPFEKKNYVLVAVWSRWLLLLLSLLLLLVLVLLLLTGEDE